MHWTLKRVRHKFTYNYLSYEKDLALFLTHFKTIIFTTTKAVVCIETMILY